jgi:SAM-dependent methyltransferase
MHAAVAGFDRDAAAYERGRPGYPPEAIEHLQAEFDIGPGTRIVELGAGTGKFTRALAATGATVIPVEPTRAMRLLLHRLDPTTPVLAGMAEHLPLQAGVADVVVAAQAFHWFATRAAVDEIVRVLRPGGGLGLVWNTRDETVPWRARLGALMNEHRHGIPRYTGGRWKAVFEGRSDLSPIRRRTFPHRQRADVDALVDRVLSVSFNAVRPSEDREELARSVRNLLATDPATRGRRRLELAYRTDVYTARRRASPSVGRPGRRRSSPGGPRVHAARTSHESR